MMLLDSTTAFVKRRFNDDDEEEIKEELTTYKRINGNVLSMVQSRVLEKQEDPAIMPAITYASPDYRPPIPPNALWLQTPVPPPQQQQYINDNEPEQENDHTQKLRSSGQIMTVEETDSTDEDDFATCAQTPSSILLDGQFKRSLTFGKNRWSNQGSSFIDYSATTT